MTWERANVSLIRVYCSPNTSEDCGGKGSYVSVGSQTVAGDGRSCIALIVALSGTSYAKIRRSR